MNLGVGKAPAECPAPSRSHNCVAPESQCPSQGALRPAPGFLLFSPVQFSRVFNISNRSQVGNLRDGH